MKTEAVLKIIVYGQKYTVRVKEHSKAPDYWVVVDTLLGETKSTTPPYYIRKISTNIIKIFRPKDYPEYFI